MQHSKRSKNAALNVTSLMDKYGTQILDYNSYWMHIIYNTEKCKEKVL